MENHPELNPDLEFIDVSTFCVLSKDQEAFFAVAPEDKRTFFFPYYGIEAMSHVFHETNDLRKRETLCVILSGQHSVIIQGHRLMEVGDALRDRHLKYLMLGHVKESWSLVIASIEVQIGDAGNR